MILILAVRIAQFRFKVASNANHNAFRVPGGARFPSCIHRRDHSLLLVQR